MPTPSPAYMAHLDQQIAAYDALYDHLDDVGRELLKTYEELRTAALVFECDRVLAIAGHLCLEYEAAELFERIFATVLDGCNVQPGDARRFLSEPHS